MDAVLDSVECLLSWRAMSEAAYAATAATRKWPRSIERTSEGYPRAWQEEGIDPDRRLLRFADFFFRNYRYRTMIRARSGDAVEMAASETAIERAMLDHALQSIQSDPALSEERKAQWLAMVDLVIAEACPERGGASVNWETIYRGLDVHESSGRRLKKALAAYLAKSFEAKP